MSRDSLLLQSVPRLAIRSELSNANSEIIIKALHSAHPESWLYARAAFLFFCALLISWVPSSANRLYALVHPDVYIFGLNYTESLVLPL